MNDLQLMVPDYLLMIMRPLFTPLTGKVGDIGFFFNRTWHGRFSNTSSPVNDVILSGFFPVGAHMGFPSPYVDWSKDFLQSIQGTELGRLMDPSIGTERRSDGFYNIVSVSNMAGPDTPYALEIEALQGSRHRLYGLRLGCAVMLLRASAWIRVLVVRMFRKIMVYVTRGK